MAFWNRKKNWEDEYDEYYVQDRQSERKRPTGQVRVVPHLLLLGVIGMLFLAGAGIISGVTMVEQLLTSVATPLGVVWITLMITVYFCLLSRQAWPAIAGFFCWTVLTIAGNQVVTDGLCRSLEAPLEGINIDDIAPLDTIVILGGGTDTTISGRPQLGMMGDRIAVATSMYHAGQVSQLVCTGTQQFASTPKDLHPREEATEILIALGIPSDVIFQISGNNTLEEMKMLKQWLDENDSPHRIGIVTSAWHLPRALRLAENQGLELIPIPSNFLSRPFAPTPSLIVPSSENLMITAIMIKEYLARLVGR